MSDYIRRSGKFIIYLGTIFVLVLVIFPMISGNKASHLTLFDLIHNQRYAMFIGLLLAYAFVYPLIAFVKIKRHLNGTFADNREVFEKAFETLQYIMTEETADKIIYRKKSQFARFTQWYEDSVVIHTAENPVIITGMRKSVTRIDRIIDHLLIKASE